MKHWFSLMAAMAFAAGAAAQSSVPAFQKIQITPQFWSEGASYADFNHDGKMDIVSGPFWYEGPDFKVRHEYFPSGNHSFKTTNSDGQVSTIEGFEGALGSRNQYSQDFLTFTADINGDGWTDIIIVGFPGEKSYWYENPHNRDGLWPRHEIVPHTDNESPCFGKLLNDGKPALICCMDGCVGYAEPDSDHPAAPWKFHHVSANRHFHKFTHGLGFGDVNGDGRNDILMMDGWYEQPSSLEGDPQWKFHPFPFATIKEPSTPQGSSQMYAYDVNGDGLPDVITALAAHGFGLAWYEQLPDKDTNGEIQFKQHLVLNPNPAPNKFGVAFSQLHSVALADINGDGLMDIVTGKRFWAHGKNGADPQSNYPAVLYWFQLVRGENHTAQFIPHLIDTNSGVGTEVTVGDVNGDGRPDIVVGNKKGTFVFLQKP